jgi:excisionase family DNA binding protein
VRDAAQLADDRARVIAERLDRVLGKYRDRATISPEELAEVLGVSRGHGYALCREGRVQSIRVGRSVRVPVPALCALLLGAGNE